LRIKDFFIGFIILSVLPVFIFVGCTSDNNGPVSSSPTPVCTPLGVAAWNDTDSAVMAQNICPTMLDHTWYDDFVTSNSRKPNIYVQVVVNKSCQDMDLTFLREAIIDELIIAGDAGDVTTTAQGSDYTLTGEYNVQPGVFNGNPVLFFYLDFKLSEDEQTLNLISRIVKKNL